MPEMKMSEIKIMERTFIVASVYVSAVILAGLLIGLWRYGIDLGHVFLGTPWDSPLDPHSRGIIAIQGGLVFLTLAFGGLFIFGVLTLIKDKSNPKQQPEKKTE